MSNYKGKPSTMKGDIRVMIKVTGLADHGFGSDELGDVCFIPSYTLKKNVPTLAALAANAMARRIQDGLLAQLNPEFPAPTGVDYER